MRVLSVFIIGIHILIHVSLCEEISDGPKLSFEANESKKLIFKSREERSINDLWNSIKNTAKAFWNSLKNFATKTKDKLKTWAQNVKEKADKIKNDFVEKTKVLKEKITKVVQDILGSGEIVKKCLKEENAAIEEILLDIIKKVTNCISDEIKNISKLENYQILLNDTSFMEDIETQLNTCIETKQDDEECLHEVRKYILENVETVEEDLLTNTIEYRNMADDILEAIISCSTNGMIEASEVAAKEVIIIIQCIAEG